MDRGAIRPVAFDVCDQCARARKLSVSREEPEIPPANAPADAETEQQESEDASSDPDEAENAEPVSEQQTNTSATPNPLATENVDGAGASEEAEQVELEPGADFQTGIQGTIFEGENLEGLANAPVVIEGRGRTRSVNTNGQGVYRAFVPPGRYTVRSHYDLYHARIAGLRVRRGRLLDVNLVLDPITADDAGIDEFEIAYTADTTSEVAQINLRREQTNVQDAVSAQEISRSGDSSASSAARRMVGVTIEGGNQLVVRGLEVATLARS